MAIVKRTSKVVVRRRGGVGGDVAELEGYLIYVVPGLDLFVPIVVFFAVLERLGDVSSADGGESRS